jgi:FtsP/CotA-like multicopper oxidase with cupredoxin domain
MGAKMKRRDLLKLGAVAGASSVLVPRRALAQLCPPNSGFPGTPAFPFGAPRTDSNSPAYPPSPSTTPFVAPMFIPAVLPPVPSLNPPPDPNAHQLYEQYPPQLLYEQYVHEAQWNFHPEYPPSILSTFDGTFPGPIIRATYGVPILVRRYNNLPTTLSTNFGSPLITTHLHNFHSAAESDGNPAARRWFGPGTYWDYHYAMFPAGQDPNERMNQLWYHDHMMGFTAANVYRGLLGCFYVTDDQDTGNENDTSPTAFRLPSGNYDVALKLIDMRFDQSGYLLFDNFNTDGILGDKWVVNGVIQPYFRVEARKYRFRLLNAGPARFHDLYIGTDPVNPNDGIDFVMVTVNGNFLPAPRTVRHIPMGPAERSDIIVDFSQFPVGTSLYLQNRLHQTDPRGPELPLTTDNPGDSWVRFDIIPATGPDNSQIPAALRPLPNIADIPIANRRTLEFDYDGGLWTINGSIFDTDTPMFTVTENTAEIWTLRNSGNMWSHPIHIHMEEFQVLSYNGKPVPANSTDYAITQTDYQARKDVMRLMPNDEFEVFIQFRDFLGAYVFHCHNIFHEDHAMMWRFDVVPA